MVHRALSALPCRCCPAAGLGPSRPRTRRLVGANAAAQGPRLVSPLEGHIVAPAKTTNSSVAAPETLELIDRYWRAANYLSVGQIYLLDNPLLREPLQAEHVKPRLLGHWGTTPGLNLLYAHLNRAIKERDLNAIYVTGPGHGGPGLVANAYLEGTYSEVYPHDRPGRGRHAAGCSASSPSPAASPATSRRRRPGSIHEGGELGYALVARLRRGLRQPRPARRRASSATARPRPARWPTSWHSNKFLEPGPRRRRAADPAPQRLQDRQPDRAGPDPARTSCRRCSRATATRRTSSRATTRRRCTSSWPPRSTRCSTRSRRIQQPRARDDGSTEPARAGR